MPPAVVLTAGIARSLGAWMVLATDRAAPAKFGVREIALCAREGALQAVYWTLAPLTGLLTTSPPFERAIGARVPVLLVPELHQQPLALFLLGVYLRQRGFGPVWTMPHLRQDNTLPEYAEHVAKCVEQFRQASGSEQIDIVAHGTGGLAAAWYLRHMNRGAVRRLVTLGTPWKGTRMAVFVRGRVGSELLFGSPLLDSLQPLAVPTIAVYSPDDPWIIPSSSAVPAGATTVRIEGASHLDFAASARAWRAVQAALTDGIAGTKPILEPA